MTGEDTGEREYASVRVPAALRDRADQLFVDARGYEPASFQESLRLVVDLAAARAEAEVDGDAEADATELDGAASAGSAGEPTPAAQAAADEAAGSTATASFDGAGDVSTLTADPVDDVAGDAFEDLDLDGPAVTTGESDGAADDATDDEPAIAAGSVPESLRADPESNCALCGDVHPVSVLETTILDGAGSVALICPDCAE